MAKKQRNEEDGAAAQFQQDWLEVAERKEAVVLVLTFEEAWFTISAIQVAVADLQDGVPAKEYAVEVARKIQRLVCKTPTLAAVADAGWVTSAPSS